MEFQFAKRMDMFQAGIFNVLDDKRKELQAQGLVRGGQGL